MSPRKRRGHPLLHGLIVIVLIAASAYFTVQLRKDEPSAAPPVEEVTSRPSTATGGDRLRSTGKQRWERLKNPVRSVLRNADGKVLGTFTDGARTATLTGPSRTFDEPAGTDSKVVTDNWARLMPRQWKSGAQKEKWFQDWLRKYYGSTNDDLFAYAFQYVHGAPAKKNADGIAYRGAANFGPYDTKGDNYRLEQSDFYDYLGIPYTFRNGTTMQPEPAKARSLDCSGFIRTVVGFRGRYPLAPLDGQGDGLPRTANGMARSKEGADIIKLRGSAPWYERPSSIDVLQPGDLVFFKMDRRTDERLDHVAMVLGTDTDGHLIFISSRKEQNGPTIGDKGGTSRLDGNGYYAKLLRSAKRL